MHISKKERDEPMARVQVIIPNKDKYRYMMQAKREGMSLSAWLRAAAQDRLEAYEKSDVFKSVEELRQFFEECDAMQEPGVEPDWEEHKRVIHESRMRGLPRV